MNKHISEINDDSELDAEVQVTHLYDAIKHDWRILAKPNGYMDFLDKYKCGNTIPLEEINIIKDRFNGINTSTEMSFDFISSIAKDIVAYEHKENAQPPLKSLIKSIFQYGFECGKRSCEIKNNIKDEDC